MVAERGLGRDLGPLPLLLKLGGFVILARQQGWEWHPHPYRLRGGDVVGWDSIGYEAPPEVDRRARRQRPQSRP